MSKEFTFNFTQDHLSQMIPGNNHVAEWYQSLSDILPKYEINTPRRVAAFVAQCAHESGNFKILKENLYYRSEGLMRVWPGRFNTLEIANKYAMQPEKIANKAYSDRMGNGPESSGDGWKYSGKGLIQLTGKENYSRFSKSIHMPIEQIPEYLITFEGSVQSACWFWQDKNLNQFADSGDILTLTKRINGGTIGLADREKHYAHALHVLGGEISESSHSNSEPDMSATIRRGSKGPIVAAVQTKLGLTADGDFGPGTEKALMRWQRENKLEPDGIAGPLTLNKILG